MICKKREKFWRGTEWRGCSRTTPNAWRKLPQPSSIRNCPCIRSVAYWTERHLRRRLFSFSPRRPRRRSEEHTSELQSRLHLVCRLLLEKKKTSQQNDRRDAVGDQQLQTTEPERILSRLMRSTQCAARYQDINQPTHMDAARRRPARPPL